MPAGSPSPIDYFRTPLEGVEAMRACTARAFGRHTHDHYGIGLVDAGGHSSWSGRGQVEAGPGTFITVNPGEVHDGAPVGDRPRSWRIFYLEPATLAALRADVLEGGGREFTFAAPTFVDASLRRSFDTAFAHVRGADSPLEFETALLGLLARLETQAAARARVSRSRATADVSRARERIDADPAAAITLHDLAREAGVSRYQLIRAFQRDVGLAPHAYLVQRRLALARRLLRARRPLPEVAQLAGFFDQSHLGRCFVRQFGVSPGRYALSS